MKKKLPIILILLIVLSLFYFRDYTKLQELPKEYLKENSIDRLFIEFKDGGNVNYYSKVDSNITKISDKTELIEYLKLIEKLDYDEFANHRPSDYNVYINFNDYENQKRNISMSKIENEYIFFWRKGKYRNDDLAKKIIKDLQIDLK